MEKLDSILEPLFSGLEFFCLEKDHRSHKIILTDLNTLFFENIHLLCFVTFTGYEGRI